MRESGKKCLKTPVFLIFDYFTTFVTESQKPEKATSHNNKRNHPFFAFHATFPNFYLYVLNLALKIGATLTGKRQLRQIFITRLREDV